MRSVAPSLFPMIGNPTALAEKLQATFGRRPFDPKGAPFQYRDRTVVPTVSSGIFEIDALTGGFPRGGLTEICGSACSGRTSLFLAALAARTAQGEICGLVDGRDAFDPASASSAGVRLDQLLWVRCNKLDQALRAVDLLIQAGGFGFIALDLSDIPAQLARRIPLNLWFRFRRAVEDTPTVLMVLEQDANAKTCASLVLRCIADSARWKTAATAHARDHRHSVACLLGGMNTSVEVVRARVKPVVEFRPSGGGCRSCRAAG